MKNKIIALSLLVIFTLAVPSINANIICLNQIEQNKHFSNDFSNEDIKILFVWGGRKVNVLIKNIGGNPLTNIPWEIGFYHWHGFYYERKEGIIEKLDVGEKTIITKEIQNRYITSVEVSIHIGELSNMVRKSLDAWWIWSLIIFGIFR